VKRKKKKKIEEANWSSLSTTDIGGLLHHQTKLTFVFTTLLLTPPHPLSLPRPRLALRLR
jgi:hypothetical protein